ncbi:MAG TPA: nitrate/nitrite transporter [Dehalococcoidia bacterium]|nr:nitrate/nitrite transporter [Dehalococcoidia bacterium]
MRRHLATLLREGDPRTLLASFLYFDTSFMVWVLLGALGNFIADDLGLTGAQKGLMTALPVLSGAMLRLPLGAAADRFGGRRVGLFGLSLTLAPLATGWLLADRLTVVYVVGLLLGVAGASFAVALPLASRWYPPERQGLALGIAGAGNSGTVLASLFAPRLAEAFGWQAVFGLAMVPVAATIAVFALTARDSPVQVAPPRLRDVAAVLRQADALWFCLFYGVTFGGFVGLASYLAIFLRDQYGLSKVAAGDLTAACVFAGSFARPLGGLVADRAGGIRALLSLFTLVGAAILAVSGMPPIGLSAALLFGSMALLGMGNGAVFQLVPQRFRREIGVATGLVGAAGGVGGFLLPFLLGFLQELTGSYGPGFALFALAALAASRLLATVQRGWRRTWAPDGSPARGGRPGWRRLPTPGQAIAVEADRQ